jgi:exosome complex RNA-binding protein Csl4
MFHYQCGGHNVVKRVQFHIEEGGLSRKGTRQGITYLILDTLKLLSINSQVELYKFVQPGDIILARVLGYGEANTSFLLTIAEDQLGVIIGRGQNGQKLIPESSTLMKEKGNPEYREMRKVGQLPLFE